MRAIDINCDLGEGAGHDDRLMPFVTSANIACGGHVGDADSMRAALELAAVHGVACGAHPSLPDREGFGRREQAVSVADIHTMVYEQTMALIRVASDGGWRLTHVKPHGALYNMAARHPHLARAVADAVRACDPQLALVGLAGSHSIREAAAAGLRAVPEAFADRAYQPDGTLVPRSLAHAVLEDDDAVCRQALAIARDHLVLTIDGIERPVTAETLCLHGDGARAAEMLQQIRRTFVAAGIDVRPFAAVRLI